MMSGCPLYYVATRQIINLVIPLLLHILATYYDLDIPGYVSGFILRYIDTLIADGQIDQLLQPNRHIDSSNTPLLLATKLKMTDVVDRLLVYSTKENISHLTPRKNNITHILAGYADIEQLLKILDYCQTTFGSTPCKLKWLNLIKNAKVYFQNVLSRCFFT